FHYLAYNLRLALASSADTQTLGFKFWVGPHLSYVDSFRGAQTGLTRFLSLHSILEMTSHYYEYYHTNPRTAFNLRLVSDLNSRRLLSDATAQRFMMDGHYLYNFIGLDPPLLVLGLRGGLYETLASQNPDTLAKIPPTYRFYLGGSA